MKSPSFQFYPRDWIASLTVLQMTGEEVKAYLYLLCAAWLNEPRATLPNDDRKLAAISRVGIQEWMAMKPAIIKCFKITPYGLVNEKMLQISNIQQKNRLNGLNHKPNHKPNAKPNYNPNGKPKPEPLVAEAEAEAEVRSKGRSRSSSLNQKPEIIL